MGKILFVVSFVFAVTTGIAFLAAYPMFPPLTTSSLFQMAFDGYQGVIGPIFATSALVGNFAAQAVILLVLTGTLVILRYLIKAQQAKVALHENLYDDVLVEIARTSGMLFDVGRGVDAAMLNQAIVDRNGAEEERLAPVHRALAQAEALLRPVSDANAEIAALQRRVHEMTERLTAAQGPEGLAAYSAKLAELEQLLKGFEVDVAAANIANRVRVVHERLSRVEALVAELGLDAGPSAASVAVESDHDRAPVHNGADLLREVGINPRHMLMTDGLGYPPPGGPYHAHAKKVQEDIERRRESGRYADDGDGERA